MSKDVYEVLHFVGLALVLLALGGVVTHVANGGTKQSNTFRKTVMISHGVGLLLLLVGGFGMLAKLGIHGVPLWVGIKLVVWLILGALVGVIYKKPSAAKSFWFLIPVLVLIATLAALTKIGA